MFDIHCVLSVAPVIVQEELVLILFLPYMDQAFLVGQWKRICQTVPEIRVRSQIQEDPLEKEMAAHSSILSCRIPWTEQPVWLPSMALQ